MKRYPGIQSFDQDRKHLFFGRERETKELFRLAVLHPIVVLFGKSGTGKTSLIQAGVTPLLHERRLHPVFLRLNQTQTPIPQQIHAILDEGEYLPYNTPNNLSLWDYCHQFAYDESGDSFTPLYVLDQFEELFTLYADQPEEQKRFITQLAQVMNGNAPEGSRRTTPPKAHFLISIRSDYLYLLDRLSDQIPAILRTRYELSDLDTDNARKAIEQPALAQGNFDSPPFAYSPDALQNIIAELSQEQTGTEQSRSETNNQTQTREIGGFQLQLLCQRIEQKVIEKYPVAPTQELVQNLITITPEFYGGGEGIRQIIGEFYNSVLQKYPDPTTRHHIQQLIEEGLISNGRRIILEENYLKDRYHLTQADIEQLNTERICRKEARANQWYYEISHDTLLKPIIAAYEKRRETEEKLRLEREKEEAQRKAKEIAAQAEKDRQLREAAEIAKQEAEQQKNKAEQETQRANQAKQEAEQQKNIAEQETQRANQAKQEAEQQKNIAEQETQRANQAKQEAEQQKNIAEQETQRANQAKQEAEQQKNIAEQETQRANQAKRRANIFTVIAIAVALAAIGAGLYAMQQRAKAEQAQEETQNALDRILLNQRKTAAEKLYGYAQEYDGLGQKTYYCENLQKALDTLRNHTQDSLYIHIHNEQQQRCK